MAHNVQVGHWKTKTSLEKYLQTCSVSPKIQKEVYENFHPNKRGANSKDVECIFLAIWNSLLLKIIFIGCGMHNIFRGIIADCTHILESLMTHHKVYTEFERNINPHLEELLRLRLNGVI